MAVKTQDDYAKDLAGLKSSYMSATTDQDKSVIKQKGLALRNQASTQGIDLNALEDSANKAGGFQTGPDEGAFRQQTFSAAKPAEQASSANNSGNTIKTEGMRFSNDWIEQANKMMTQLSQMATTRKAFDPTTNATYQAAQKLAGEAANTAQHSTLETMNDRGIINSSVTSSQLGQVAQKAQLEPLKLIPQLESNYNQQQQQDFTNLSSVAGTMLNTGIDQQKFNAQLPMQEAAITGKYLSGDAQGLIQNLLGLKQAAEQQGVTPEQMSGYKSQADVIRNKLATFGVDANALFGSEQDASQAAANVSKAGQLTTDAQKTLASTLLGLTDTFGSIQKGTGAKLGELPLFSGLSDTITGLEGKSTMAKDTSDFNKSMATKQFDLSQEKFTFDKSSDAGSKAIQWANVNLSKARLDQDQTKLQNDENSKMATKGYLTQILAKGSREEAMSYIVDHAPDMLGDNANIDSILNSIDAKFPKPANASSSSAPKDNTFDVNKTALDMAQKDMRWLRARDPKSQDAIIKEYKDRLLSQ